MTDTGILERDPKLAELVRPLVQAHQPARFYLFGSRGRERGAPDSDHDLLMIFERLELPAYQIAQQAHGLVWGLGLSADILVWSREELDEADRPIPCADRSRRSCDSPWYWPPEVS